VRKGAVCTAVVPKIDVGLSVFWYSCECCSMES